MSAPAGRALPAADIDLVLEQTGCDVWRALSDARLFVTGGTGFFGKWLLETFVAAVDRFELGATMTVLTRDAQGFAARFPALSAHPSIRFHTGDVRSFEFPAGKFSHIIHAATEASVRVMVEDPQAMLDTITQGTRRVLELARVCGATRFLLTSSGGVYGRQPPEMNCVYEDYSGAPDPLEPHACYSEGKRYSEMLCAIYARQYDFEVCIARCFAFIGPYLPVDSHFAAGNFLRDALRGGPIEIRGDGTPLRSYLHAADLTSWLWTLLVKGKSCQAYNVGSEECLSIADLAHRIATACGKVEVKIAQKAVEGKLPERYVPSALRMSNEFEITPKISIDEAIRRTVDWLKLEKEVYL